MNQKFVLTKCKENIRKANAIQVNPNVSNISKIMVGPLLKRVEKIEELCTIEEYNLCFIGKVGIGKSTAISNLLGFINKDKLQPGETLSEIPLLKTGSGRTTLCETEIVFFDDEGKNVKIEIEGICELELKEIVNAYCRKVINNEADVDCSIEIQRAIENLSNFPKSEEDYKAFVEQYITVPMDEQKAFYQLAEEAILRTIDYPNRNVNELIYSGNEDINLWLKEKIAAINDCSIEGIPYPTKIIVHIKKSEWGIIIPEKIQKVVDTRGIDGEAVRSDIIALCEDKRNICIICDEIGEYGNRVSEGYLKGVFVHQNPDLQYRNFVLGLEQRDQLTNVNGADGRETGKDIKKREALNNWHAISLNKDNMLFYNSYFGIEAGKKIFEINMKEYESEQAGFWETIEHKINGMYLKYNEELVEINAQLEILATNNLEEKHKEKLIKVKAEVNQHLEALSDHYEELVSKIIDDVRGVQSAGYIRGSVNRQGDYWNFSFYDQSMQIANEEYTSALQNSDVKLISYSRALFDEEDLLEDAVQNALVYEINEAYEYYRKENRDNYRVSMLKKLLDDPIWVELKGYWGNNKTDLKYTDLIAQSIGQKIEALDIVGDIRKEHSTARFLNRLNDFLKF
ncbi:hypothetical protein [Lysinibacillus xylanilyticus]|uniref:hypothetical protein n=1 Tax=Lysinibacillus xylanilyticus TaxID=582475 RepID=UPI003D021944